MTRREFITLLGGAAVAWPIAAHAQQPRKVWRIGFIAGASRPASLEVSQFGGFQQGMREHGYVEGKDFVWSGALRMRTQSAIRNLPPSSCN
jgi:putative tryptophan/tyrosine transport system substrate-binding protein